MNKVPKKGFSWSKGKYYLTIKDSPRNITLFRKSKNDAVFIYSRYKQEGKDIEWLGCWNGKKFEETSISEAV